MPTYPKDHVVVEIAPGGDPLDPTSWVWEDITAPAAGHPDGFVFKPVTIDYGRRDEQSEVGPSKCTLTVDNSDGRFSPHNVQGPWYGRIGRNTPLRVRWGGRSDVAAVTTGQPASTVQPAPSVDAPTDAGLLLCAWASWSGTFTPPGSMTAGTEATLLGNVVSRPAWETITASGATGTRTPTFTQSQEWAAVSLLLSGADGAPPVVEEDLAGPVTFPSLTLTTSAATERGWWLYAIQTAVSRTDIFPDSPANVDSDEPWQLVADTVQIGVSQPQVKVWARPVTEDGAQGVTFDLGKMPLSTAHLIVVSGQGQERFTGLVSEWPTRWLGIVDNSRVTVTANGIQRRLIQGIEPVKSPLRSQISAGVRSRVGLSAATVYPSQYWPLEDDSDATGAASALDGGPSLGPFGEVSFAAAPADLAGSAGQVVFSGEEGPLLAGPCPVSSSATSWTIEGWVDFGAETEPDPWLNILLRLSGSTYRRVMFIFRDSGSSALYLGGFDDDDIEVALVSYSVPSDLRVGVHHVAASADTSGGNVTYRLFFDGVQVASNAHAVTAGRPTQISIESGGLDDVGVSHVAVWPLSGVAMSAALADRVTAGQAFDGETAQDRIVRICTEEGVPLALGAAPVDSPPMGAQPTGTFFEIIRDAETTDGGVVYEKGAALAYQPRAARYNQPVSLALDWGDLHGAPEPLGDDDLYYRNHITVERSGGSSAVASDDTLIVRDGAYREAVTVNTERDGILNDIAAWRLHLGTNPELRWPLIPLELAHNEHLIGDWLSMRIGDRVTVAHEFPQLPGVVIDLLVEGWQEVFHSHRWLVSLNCVPASPWTVGVLDDAATGRLDTAGSTLDVAVGDTDTSLVVASTGNVWTQDPAMFPLEVVVGGEIFTVTAISGTSSPQTFTVTRGDGATSHPAGADLRLAQPLRLAL